MGNKCFLSSVEEIAAIKLKAYAGSSLAADELKKWGDLD